MKDSEGKSPLLRPGDRWGNVKIDLKDIGKKGVSWTFLPQDKNMYQTSVSW